MLSMSSQKLQQNLRVLMLIKLHQDLKLNQFVKIWMGLPSQTFNMCIRFSNYLFSDAFRIFIQLKRKFRKISVSTNAWVWVHLFSFFRVAFALTTPLSISAEFAFIYSVCFLGHGNCRPYWFIQRYSKGLAWVLFPVWEMVLGGLQEPSKTIRSWNLSETSCLCRQLPVRRISKIYLSGIIGTNIPVFFFSFQILLSLPFL